MGEKESFKSYKYLSFTLLSLIVITINLSADITGVVFRDLPVRNSSGTLELNSYGVKEANELGVKGVTVTAYRDDGTVVTTITADDGSYTLKTGAGEYRVEISSIPSYLEESPNNDSIKFVNDGATDINFGLYDPSEYSNTATPNYLTNRQQNGSNDNNNIASIELLHYNDTGLNPNYKDGDGNNGTGPYPIKLTSMKETGSTWGKAWQKSRQRAFAAAVLQRHVGFAPNKDGSYIYVLNNIDNGSPILNSFSLQGISPANGGDNIDLGEICRSSSCANDIGKSGNVNDYVLDSNPETPNIDLDAFAQIGKISFGDIDVDQKRDRLWLINLKQKALISMDISGESSLLPQDVKQYPIEFIANLPTCKNGEIRPWALSIFRDRGYLGIICDASVSQDKDDVTAHVLSFDLENPTSGFTQILSMDMNYTKGRPNTIIWRAWTDVNVNNGNGIFWQSNPQPILTDIEFDEKGNMYLGFKDRFGLQKGYKNYEPVSGQEIKTERTLSHGDILRVCNNNGVYEVEGTGSCTQVNYPDKDEFFSDSKGDGGSEGSAGALALLKGSNEMLLGWIDPHPEGETGIKYQKTMGTGRLNTINGSITNWYSNMSSNGVNDTTNGYNGKSASMGDIEILTDPAPIEIGNRVWLDSDGDGIQDARESGIAGVKVELLDGSGKVIATAITDSKGEYLFSSDTNQSSTTNKIYKIAELKADNEYTVRIPDISGQNKQSVLANYILTTVNKGEGVNPNINDSDGEVVGSNAEIKVNRSDIPYAGANNHSFDFGFVKVVNIGDRIWLDRDADGIQDGGELDFNESVTVTLLDENNQTVTSITTTNGEYKFENLVAGKYRVKFSLPSGYGVSPEGSGGDDSQDSDVHPNTMTTDLIDVQSDNFNIDMGLYKKA